MSKKLTSTIAGASLFLALIGVFSRGIGLIREVVYAGSFGFQKNFDIFLIGSIIPMTIIGVMFYIAQNYYIPLILKLKDEENKNIIILNNFIFFILINIAIAFVLFLSADIILNFYIQNLKQNDIKIAKDIFNLHLISIPFAAGSSFITSYLYTEFEYKIPAASQIIFNLAIIGMIAFFNKSMGIYSIPIGFLIGQTIQLSILYFFAKDFINFKKIGNVRLFKLNLAFNSSIIFIILIETLGQIYFIVDRYFYKVIREGGVAALNYSFMISQLPIIIFTTALATAIFPKFSSNIANENTDNIKKNVNDSILLNIFVFIPITFVFYFYGDIIISILLERGQFTSANSAMTFSVLKYYSIGLFFYGSYGILNKLFYSYGLAKKIFFVTLAALAVKLIGSYILVKFMREEGLALSTSLSYIFFFISSIFLTNKILNVKLKDSSILLKKFIFQFLLAVSICLTLNFVNFPDMIYFKIVKMIIFLFSYYLSLYFLKEDSVYYIMDLLFHVRKNILRFKN
ncbi:MAG TPA: lipid II flippase MurJ [Ignavibacteriaceae bacterium]|nr:lipid II flippase MurJ [Ignavibacteriaceae bacterium]